MTRDNDILNYIKNNNNPEKALSSAISHDSCIYNVRGYRDEFLEYTLDRVALIFTNGWTSGHPYFERGLMYSFNRCINYNGSYV